MKIKDLHLYQLAGIMFGLFICFIFVSCESDDLCDQDTLTPRLVVRFYDKKNHQKLLPVQKLVVLGKEKTEILQPISTTDSLVLPLKVFSKSTSYRLYEKASVTSAKVSGNLAELTINYNPKQVFASKACGYKVIFTKLGASLTTKSSWISSLQIKKNQITNEKEAHLHIYH